MKADKPEGHLQNRLHATRTRLGLSQREMALAAGVTRQTIGGIEAGLYAPSAAVALRVAKALGCRVEDLFWLEDDLPTVQATLATPSPSEAAIQSGVRKETAMQAEAKGGKRSASNPGAVSSAAPANGDSATLRVMLGQVGGKWVAHTLRGAQAFRTEMIPADGLGEFAPGQTTLAARLLDEPEALLRTVLLAGCAPALSLWARSAERWHPGLRVHWLHANSTVALQQLARGEVHAAGVHLCDLHGAQDNAPYVREIMGRQPVVLVNLGVWEEGLIVRAGNPKQIREGADLAQATVVLVNRETGSGSRLLLDSLLQSENIAGGQINGYDHIVPGHLDVAWAVLSGQADVGVSASSVAWAYGLGFVPLRSVRYDLALLKTTLDYEPVQQLLSTLRHRWILSQLKALGGYDTTHTGDILEVAAV